MFTKIKNVIKNEITNECYHTDSIFTLTTISVFAVPIILVQHSDSGVLSDSCAIGHTCSHLLIGLSTFFIIMSAIKIGVQYYKRAADKKNLGFLVALLIPFIDLLVTGYSYLLTSSERVGDYCLIASIVYISIVSIIYKYAVTSNRCQAIKDAFTLNNVSGIQELIVGGIILLIENHLHITKQPSYIITISYYAIMGWLVVLTLIAFIQKCYINAMLNFFKLIVYTI